MELERVGELELEADREGIGSRGRHGRKWRWREKNVEVNVQQKRIKSRVLKGEKAKITENRRN